MNWYSWAIWGFFSTVILTITLAMSQGIKLTRMNIPFMLGTIWTSDRDKAKWIGFVIHVFNGWIFSLMYVSTFHVWGEATWVRGMLLGFIHGLFVLCLVLPNLPAIHPRMADEYFGPTVVKQLEPPGFLALNYGFPTPFSVILAHVMFGTILGLLYKV